MGFVFRGFNPLVTDIALAVWVIMTAACEFDARPIYLPLHPAMATRDNLQQIFSAVVGQALRLDQPVG